MAQWMKSTLHLWLKMGSSTLHITMLRGNMRIHQLIEGYPIRRQTHVFYYYYVKWISRTWMQQGDVI